jgi:nucleotide-binding universal stress UspA family protein
VLLLFVIAWKRLCNRSLALDQGVIAASLRCYGDALRRGDAMKKLIVATDGSEHAMRALAYAVELAAAIDAELCLVTVTPDMGFSHEELQEFSRTEQLSLGEALTGQAEQTLETARSRALALGARRVRSEAASGDPAAQLLDIAAREHADAIIVGKRGWGPLHGMLLGSISQKLAALARCPVIVVP